MLEGAEGLGVGSGEIGGTSVKGSDWDRREKLLLVDEVLADGFGFFPEEEGFLLCFL